MASLTLLHLIGRGLLEGLDDRARLAGAVWSAWSAARDESAQRAEWQSIVGASPEDLRQSLGQVVVQLTVDRPAEDRQALANALVEVVLRLRRGATEPAKADDLLVFLPDPLPVLPVDPTIGDEAALVLRVTSGPHAGRMFRFTGHDTFLVGRSKQAHFNLGPDDRYFSRVHFMIEANPPHARLVDMGSHNGTHLNGKRVEALSILTEGDRIQAGHTVLSVSLPGALALSRLPPAPEPPTLPGLPPTVQWTAPTRRGEPCRVCNPGTGGTSFPVCQACQEQMEAVPQVVPGYRMVRELGRGGMGVVHLAVREGDDAVLAVKTVIPALAGTRDQVERFLREARILEALDHPHIVAFREMGEANGLLYFAMDYVPGNDAACLVRQHGPLDVDRALRLIAPILQALDYAHAKRFVHRDVKPANILVSCQDSEEHASLADFGLARVYQASQLSGLTMTGAVGGTPAFMAPEQVTSYRDVRPAADQYAAAATLYNLLTGEHTHDFAPSVHERLGQLLHEDPIPIQERRDDLPDALSQVIHRALAREPQRRFSDAKAFRRALLAALR
jgi:serine/threonine-protein kinase